MSLLSRITARFIKSPSPLLVTVVPQPSFTSTSSPISPLFAFPTTRTYWREVLRSTPNPKNPSQVQCEDPNIMALRSARAQSAEGLLRRKYKYLRYEKPWMQRKKLKMKTKYRSMEKGVSDLKLYVKYIQEAKDIYDKSDRWK